MKTRASLIVASAIAFVPVAASADGLSDRIAVALVASHFHFDQETAFRAIRDARVNVFDSGPMFELARFGHRSLKEVADARRNARSWRDVAYQLGVNIRPDSPYRDERYFDRMVFWERMLHDRYDTSRSQFDLLEERRTPIEDVLTAVVLGANAHRQPTMILGEYRNGRTWTEVARANHVDPDQWSVGPKGGLDGRDSGGWRRSDGGL